MKKFYALAAMLLCSTALFVSCDDDNNDRNYAKIGSTSYEITDAGADYWTDGDVTAFCLYLWDDNGDFEINFCNLYCETTGTVIKDGVYAYSDSGDDMTLGTSSEYTTDSWSTSPNLSTDASITVKGYGNDIYAFTWNTTDEDGVAVKGYYKGLVEFLED